MITSHQNRRLKDIRRLRRSKGSWAILEGEHLVREALGSELSPAAVFVTPEFLSSTAGSELVGLLSVPCEVASTSALSSLADADSPPGILAVVELVRQGVEALPRAPGGIYVFADSLQDPGNLGALARVAEAVGAVGMALAPGSVSPNHPRALRASAGSLLRLPTAVDVEPGELDRYLQAASPFWITLVPRGGVEMFTAVWSGTPIVAVGAEGPGVSAGVRSRTQLEVTIPLASPVESLNATVAAALMLFEIRRRGRED